MYVVRWSILFKRISHKFHLHLNCFINLVFLKSVKIDPLNQFGWFDLLMGNISDWCPIERTQTHTHHYLSLSKNVNHDVNTTIEKLVSGNWSLKHKRWRYQVKVKKNLWRNLFVCNETKEKMDTPTHLQLFPGRKY